MSLLESVIGGVLGQVLGGRGAGMSPLVKALLMLLLREGAGGILGQGHGQGHGSEPGPAVGRPGGRDPGDIGGFDQGGGRRGPGEADPTLPGGGFDDLSGMLDGPGDAPARDGRAAEGGAPGPDAGRAGGDLAGLGGLVERLHRGGLGDAIDSWIGPGANRPVGPDQLARALGDGTVDALQRATGMDRGALLADLARALPEVVHALTPEGRISDPH